MVRADGQHLPLRMCSVLFPQRYQIGRSDFLQRALLSEVVHGLGLNPGEGMDICKCIVPLWHVGTLNRLRVTSPLVRFMEGEEEWDSPERSPGCSP
ncbi:hypothetical protein TNCV_1429831 [Trichonephila clavipes]|nr:hypothetical protein TNCV_1429831 [Trichonephila clavipes]